MKFQILYQMLSAVPKAPLPLEHLLRYAQQPSAKLGIASKHKTKPMWCSDFNSTG